MKITVLHIKCNWNENLLNTHQLKRGITDWFNHRRLLSSIGYVPPAEFEMAYYRRLEESAKVA